MNYRQSVHCYERNYTHRAGANLWWSTTLRRINILAYGDEGYMGVAVNTKCILWIGPCDRRGSLLPVICRLCGCLPPVLRTPSLFPLSDSSVSAVSCFQMGGLEAVLTGLSDEWKSTIKRFRFGREAVTAIVVFAAFLFALPNVTNVRAAVDVVYWNTLRK